MDRAYRQELWGAAYLINGGCSDDGFVYFLGWLIAQGRDVYQAALPDPDSLVSHPSVASLNARYGSLSCSCCRPSPIEHTKLSPAVRLLGAQTRMWP